VRRLAAAGVGVLLLAACHAGKVQPPPPDVVATVNGEPLTAGQLQKALVRARRDNENLTQRTGADELAFRRTTLDDLIDEMVLLQAAHGASVAVAPERIERELLRLRADYPGKAFDQALAEGAQTNEELREQIKTQLTIEEYFARQVFARVAVTDADVEAYYQAHKETFARPEEVHAEQILVEDADTAKRVQADLKRGERFEELARRYSRSPDAKVGGDLGFFARGVMPAVFDQVCFTLKPNQVSEVMVSPYGYHLFKVLERRTPHTPALADVRDHVESTLRSQREAAAQQSKVEELRKKAKLEINEKVLAAVP
jgi:peptidyl-prolyl cis-trans isomerase C